MASYGRIFGNYEARIRQSGIPATFIKNKMATLSGWYNEIKHVGYVRCENPEDKDRVMEILNSCGYNACNRDNGIHSIEVMYDTKKDDWGIKV